MFMFVCAMNAYGQTEETVEPTTDTSGDWECVLENGTLKLTLYKGTATEVTIPEKLTIKTSTESGGVVLLNIM